MNKVKQQYSLARNSLTVGLLSFSLLMQANNMANITLKVDIIAPPPCVINNNQPIEVDFGEVLTTRVDGSNYRKPINYNLTCDNEVLVKNTLKIQVQGNSTNLGTMTTVLSTDHNDLGIELQHGNTPLAINHWLSFTYPDTPKLWAVPVMKAGTALETGVFTAASILKIDYQ